MSERERKEGVSERDRQSDRDRVIATDTQGKMGGLNASWG